MGIFKTLSKDGNARLGLLSLPHGEVETPVFMPVGTKATVKGMHFSEVKNLGFNLILNNTYHVYLNIGSKILKENFKSDIRNFATSWQDNILTDSGGFQIFSFSQNNKESVKILNDGVTFVAYGAKHHFTPELCVNIQTIINSDIQMALDICSPFGIQKSLAREYKNITTKWCERAKIEWEKEKSLGYKGSLFGIFQGNFFNDLRRESIDELLELDLPGYAIGGLSVGEESQVFKEFLSHTSDILTDSFEKPLYVMGIGTPDYIFECIQNGVDMFDCVLPTRMARNGAIMSEFGRINIKNSVFKNMNKSIADLDVFDFKISYPNSPIANYPMAYLHHLLRQNEMLGSMLISAHNLYFLKDLVNKIKLSIKEKRFLAFKNQYLSNYKNSIKDNSKYK